MLPPRHQKAAAKAFWAYWPRRVLSERGWGVLLLFTAIALMIFSVAMPQVARKIRINVYDDFNIIFVTLSAPTEKIGQLVEHLSGMSDMAGDLATAREENARLKQWYDRALQLEAENRSLRSLVNLANLPRTSYVSARIIAESGNGFAQSVIVDAGKNQGVQLDSVAMTGDGVVGRVISSDDDTSQVILLTDVNTRIPVLIENSRHRGVLAGDNTAMPQLMYLPEDAAIQAGERVLTSGSGGVFVPGLPVGVIISATPGNIRVRPFADLRRLEVVQLIRFEHKPVTPPPESIIPEQPKP
jgi:rod shape-determining protein MreC